jgi:SAM-dependent methyltransferase
MHTHIDYVKDYDSIESYSEYNKQKYISDCRECDLSLMDLVEKFVGNIDSPSIIDLGCGSGHQLYHLRNRLPKAHLEGRDLAKSLIDSCMTDEKLRGMTFAVHDITSEPPIEDREQFDIVIVTAVLQVLPFDLQKKAIANIAMFLKPGGIFINFDGYHNFEKIDCFTIQINNVISEKPPTSTMTYYYPSKILATTYCEYAGLGKPEFVDFSMSKDLPYSAVSPPSSFTIKTEEDMRLSMLGIVAQPWSFLIATK